MAFIHASSGSKLFGPHRPLHAVLGGGRAADVILWKNRNLSAAILAGSTVIWFLIEIVEYPLVTLVCHASIVAILAIFLWTNGAALLNRTPPKIPDVISSKHAFDEVALAFHTELSGFVSVIHDVASGKDLKLLLLIIASLWILSVLGSYCSFTSLLYLGIVCIHTLPVLYERYEQDVDYLAERGNRDVKKLYRKFDSKVLKKIPRGPVKERKFK